MTQKVCQNNFVEKFDTESTKKNSEMEAERNWQSLRAQVGRKTQVITTVLRNSSKPLLLKTLWIFNPAFHNIILLKLPLLMQSRETMSAEIKSDYYIAVSA